MGNLMGDVNKALLFLKINGPQPLCNIAEELNVTMEGARHQLLKLASEGLVDFRSESKGRGRPQQIWSISEAGQSKFPDKHAELAQKLLSKMEHIMGKDAVKNLVDANCQDAQDKYRKELEGISGLEEKIKCLASLREAEGYMASYESTENGFLLIENNCPIGGAAMNCPRFCHAELNTFQALFGKSVTVTRVDHMLSGQHRCSYAITPVNPK
ncbi:MarR family transcriptional regulator [Chitinophaga silvatica]|uniref:MarR family transcriptional regulator n=1 Tax=Chitinophaga silvatica TaxID=2282649 RepID=A0A3E1Y8Q6_9BACT|nr:MarR family transcriptional regulator [Chitinophaga silvatica]RFS21792.1 MarR family transcriptional regulator [Chitinophaga silvatica]